MEKCKKKFQQDQISPTNCSSRRNSSTKSDPFHKLPPPIFLLQVDSLQKTFNKTKFFRQTISLLINSNIIDLSISPFNLIWH